MLYVSDSCGIRRVRCFHIYQNKKRKYCKIKKFIKVSYRKAEKRLSRLVGRKSRAFFFKSKFRFLKPDGSLVSFTKNACVLLKKRLYPRGKISRGVVLYNIKRRKLIASFNYVL